MNENTNMNMSPEKITKPKKKFLQKNLSAGMIQDLPPRKISDKNNLIKYLKIE
jgi:hypothetical protein